MQGQAPSGVRVSRLLTWSGAPSRSRQTPSQISNIPHIQLATPESVDRFRKQPFKPLAQQHPAITLKQSFDVATYYVQLAFDAETCSAAVRMRPALLNHAACAVGASTRMSKHFCPTFDNPRPTWSAPARQPPSRMDQPLPALLRGLSLRAPSAADAVCIRSCLSAAPGGQRPTPVAAGVSLLRTSVDTDADSQLAEEDTARAAEAGALLQSSVGRRLRGASAK